MSRRPGSVPVAVAGTLAAALVGLTVFLAAQGLDRADQWAGVLALFLGMAALTVQAWGVWSSSSRPAGDETTAGSPDPPVGPKDRARRRSAGRPVGRLPVVLSAFLVAAAVGLVAAVLRDGGSTVEAAPGWAEVGSADGAVIGDYQSIDLDSGTVGGQHLPGAELFLSQRANRLTATAGGELAVLGETGEHTVRRCLDVSPELWDGMVNGMHDLPTGTDICLTDGESTAAMITIEQPPDVLARTLTFRYTRWELRRQAY